MNTARAETPSLRVLVASRPGLRVLAPSAALRGRDIGASTIFASRRRELAGKSVLIGAQSQFVAARALIELDGLAARLVICPPDFSPGRLASVISQAEVDAIVSDAADKDFGAEREIYLCADPVPIDEEDCFTRLASQWGCPRPARRARPSSSRIGSKDCSAPSDPRASRSRFGPHFTTSAGTAVYRYSCAPASRALNCYCPTRENLSGTI